MRDTTSTAPNHSHDCPGGCPDSGRLNLLTSMVRYYICDSCARHWHVLRLDVPEPPDTFSPAVTA
jgi:hypothetical protein